MFKIQNGRDSFYQWDLNQKLIVSDQTITEVHFCNGTDNCSLVVDVYEQDGARLADVPNILLQESLDIRAYAYCGECYTKQSASFKVIARTKPADYVYTETEVKTLEYLTNKIDEIESLAKGAVAGESFICIEHLVDILNNAAPDAYKPAQHLLIATLGVPDVWIYEVRDEHRGYTYTDDETFCADLAEMVQVGFCVLSPLETQKVDLTDYVKKDYYGSANRAGLVKTQNDFGIYGNPANGMLSIVGATNAVIDNKVNGYMPIVPKNLDYAVKVGITTNKETLTDDEKAAALEWLGAVKKPAANAGGYYTIPVVNGDGTESSLLISGTNKPLASAIPQYNTDGRLVTTEPLTDLQCANKKYVDDTCVPKLTEGNGVYIHQGETQKHISYGYSANPYTIAYRDDKGNFQVNAPVNETDCANKKYVDENKGTKLYLHTLSDGAEGYKIISTSAEPMTWIEDTDGNGFATPIYTMLAAYYFNPTVYEEIVNLKIGKSYSDTTIHIILAEQGVLTLSSDITDVVMEL